MGKTKTKFMAWLTGRYQVAFAIGIFIIIQLFYLDVDPIWDGRWYIKSLFKNMDGSFSILDWNLAHHVSMAYGALLNLTQWISFGSIPLIHILHILLGILGIFSFYKILEKIFGEKYLTEIFFLTIIFAIHLLFLATSVNPNLDFPATNFLLGMMAALFYGRTYLFVLMATLAILTRETSLGIYMVTFLSYTVFFFTRRKGKLKRSDFTILLILLMPIVIYGLYTIYRMNISVSNKLFSWGNESTEVNQLFKLLFRNDWTNPYIRTRLYQLTIMNFNWIFSSFILIYAAKRIVGFVLNKESFPNPPKEIDKRIIYVLALTLLFNTILLINYITFVLPRYVIPLVPLFLIIGYYFLVLITPKKIGFLARKVFLLIMIPLFFIQNFFTIDPISKSVFGTFQFGNHTMLCMQKFVSLEDCGRDQIAYNLQYTAANHLTNMALMKMLPDINQELHIIASAEVNHPHLIANIELGHGTTLKKADGISIIEPTLYTFKNFRTHAPTLVLEKLSDNELPDSMYHLKFPMYGETREANWLARRGYSLIQSQTFDHKGYILEMNLFTRN